MPKIDAHPPGTPSWVDLITPDLAAARRFYGGLFGWTFDPVGADDGAYTLCRIDGDVVAGIGEHPPDDGYPSSWNTYFAVADAEEAAVRAVSLGAELLDGPVDVMEAGVLAFCADPTGAVFALWQPKAHRGAERIDEPGAMAWREVNTRDAATARAFYAALLSLDVAPLEGMAYWTLERDGAPQAGVMQMDGDWPADLPPHWMNYFAVADTDAAADTVRRLGGEVHVPPFDTPFGRIAVVSDPAGAMFSLIQLALDEA